MIQLPRHPQLTDAEALVLGRDSLDLWLREHALVTVNGLLDRLDDLVNTAAEALHVAWSGRLVARPSFFQLTAVRKARTAGTPLHLIAHEDVLIFAKPANFVGSDEPKCSGPEPERGQG